MIQASDQFLVTRVEVLEEDRRYEQLGTKAKFWFTGSEGSQQLFKQGRENEDWAEKVASHVAGLLGIPHALVELATCDEKPGIVSRSFLRKGDRLVHGNELLYRLDEGYPLVSRYHNTQHTVGAVLDALESFHVVAGWSEGVPVLPRSFDGRDLFTGYLLFDAWIGNTDRHHENWAIVQRGPERLLAPSYDHGSSMGRNETEERMEMRLRGRDPRMTVRSYAERGQSAIYRSAGDLRPMSTVEAFLAAAHSRPQAAAHWLSRLRAVESAQVREVLQRVPLDRISELHREFASRLMENNRERLLAHTCES